MRKRLARGYEIVTATPAVGALITTARLATTKATKAGRRRPRLAKSEATTTDSGEMSLLEWRAAAEVQQTSSSQPRAPNRPGEARAAAAAETEGPLMQKLGKPATSTERERAFSALTLAARLRGISLIRGGMPHVAIQALPPQ